MNYFSGGCFICLTRNRPVNPFVAWGWGRTSRKTERGPIEDQQKEAAINLDAGFEVPLARYLTLEGRIGDVFALGEGQYGTVQLALQIGPSY